MFVLPIFLLLFHCYFYTALMRIYVVKLKVKELTLDFGMLKKGRHSPLLISIFRMVLGVMEKMAFHRGRWWTKNGFRIYNELQRTTTNYNLTTTNYNKLQRTTTVLQRTTTNYNRTTTNYNELQRTTTNYNELQTNYNEIQRTTTNYNELQRTTTNYNRTTTNYNELQPYYNTLQRTTTNYNELQRTTPNG